MAHRLVDTPEKTGSAHSGVAQHSGNTILAIENTVSRVTEAKPRCENEVSVCADEARAYRYQGPCNAPDAEFYEWNEGGVAHESFLCSSCARYLGVA